MVTWLCTAEEANQLNGTTIEAQYFCYDRGLLPGWPGPVWKDNHIRYDRSGAIIDDLERELAGRQDAGTSSNDG